MERRLETRQTGYRISAALPENLNDSRQLLIRSACRAFCCRFSNLTHDESRRITIFHDSIIDACLLMIKHVANLSKQHWLLDFVQSFQSSSTGA